MSRSRNGNGISRRKAIGTLGLSALALGGAGVLGGGCAGAGGQPPDGATGDDLGEAPDGGVSADLAGDRADQKEPGDLARQLTPAELLAGIETVVVLMMENRSFDHYLGALRLDPSYAARAELDGLRGDEMNMSSAGMPVRVFSTKNRTPKDPPHGWDACHAQWNGGKNDGFVQAHAGAGSEAPEVMGYHDRAAIPYYHALADRYTVCDRWFCSVMGPTWPNRYYLHAATSFGKKDNSSILDGSVLTLWDRLRDKGIAGKNYAAGIVAFYAGGFLGKLLAGVNPTARLDDFFADAKAGTLPPFCMIDPDFQKNDDHPSHDINLGQALIASVVAALAASPQWSKSLLVITYDEHGGFFDHVSPPAVEDERPEFKQLGFRVPTLVIGPTVRRGHVSHTLFEHSTLAATLRTRFGITSLNRRMELAADLSSCIDPMLVKNPQPPPTGLPKLTINLRAALESAEASSQEELTALLKSGRIPRHHLDARSTAARTESWLRHAAALSAITLV